MGGLHCELHFCPVGIPKRTDHGVQPHGLGVLAYLSYGPNQGIRNAKRRDQGQPQKSGCEKASTSTHVGSRHRQEGGWLKG